MASNLKVDIVKPTATNGSLSLKGDSGGSATTNGISVDSSGNTSITGTTTIATADINGGAIDGTTIGASSAAAGTFTQADIDNLRLDANTISSTDTNGNITLDPNGAGIVSLDGAVTINDSGADVDFRVESDTVDHALFVQGSDGYVGIGVSSPADKLHVDGNIRLTAGGGINFSAYATTGNPSSNLLDDYEEGTWTPTFSGATITPTVTTGTYVKIGKLVYIKYYSSSATITSASGSAKISNLPFSASTSNGYGIANYIFGDALTGTRGGYIDANEINFIENDTTTSATWVNGSKYIMIAGCYTI